MAIIGAVAGVSVMLVSWAIDAALCGKKDSTPDQNPVVDIVNGVAGRAMDESCKMLPWR